eukprot:m.544224 g.544224  ORF g.544224 m.544224 type:complete len:52 (-) comp22137_c0_seq3:134-289(-)
MSMTDFFGTTFQLCALALPRRCQCPVGERHKVAHKVAHKSQPSFQSFSVWC